MRLDGSEIGSLHNKHRPACAAANIATVVIATTVHPKRELGWPCISFLSEAITRIVRIASSMYSSIRWMSCLTGG